LRALFEVQRARVLVMARQLLRVHPKRQAELCAQRKGILFFLKRFGFFPFVGGEHINNPTLTNQP